MEHPNILLIVTEQHRGDCLGVEGHPVLQTPNMDSIARNGVRFRRFYSACPTCISSRRSLLNGQLPQTHGMVGYQGNVEWDAPTLPQTLRDHGYQTAWMGRSMHQHPVRKRYGYEEMEIYTSPPNSDYHTWLKEHAPSDSGQVFGGGVMHNDCTVRPWHLDDYLHHTNWTVERSLNFLRRRDPSRPFFLTMSFLAAHPPLQPPSFYFERYLRTGTPERLIGDWEVPPPAATDVSSRNMDLQGEALSCARAAYYGLINHMDDQLRRVINPVTGIVHGRDTIIVFTSDHGEMLGDHYCWAKGRPLEGSARIPMLLSAPARYGLKEGTVLDAVGTHADLMPTLLDMADVPVPETVDGCSLLPLMQGKTTKPVRPYLHIEHSGYDQGLTDGVWKYAWSPSDGRELLFHLEEDPGELHNLAGDPAAREEQMRWRGRLIEQLEDRPEGYVRDGDLVVGQKPRSLLPHGGTPTGGLVRQKWQ